MAARCLIYKTKALARPAPCCWRAKLLLSQQPRLAQATRIPRVLRTVKARRRVVHTLHIAPGPRSYEHQPSSERTALSDFLEVFCEEPKQECREGEGRPVARSGLRPRRRPASGPRGSSSPRPDGGTVAFGVQCRGSSARECERQRAGGPGGNARTVRCAVRVLRAVARPRAARSAVAGARSCAAASRVRGASRPGVGSRPGNHWGLVARGRHYCWRHIGCHRRGRGGRRDR
jgi:hypothetical protein